MMIILMVFVMTKLMEIELVMTGIDTDIDDYECGIICINAYDDKYDDETR